MDTSHTNTNPQALHKLTFFVSHDYDFSSETSPSVSMTMNDDDACRVSVTSLALHCERTHWNEVSPASSSCSPPEETTSSPLLCSGATWWMTGELEGWGPEGEVAPPCQTL